MGFPGGTGVKEPACQLGDIRDTGSIPGSGRSPGVGSGNPLQYYCLENPIDCSLPPLAMGSQRVRCNLVTENIAHLRILLFF